MTYFLICLSLIDFYTLIFNVIIKTMKRKWKNIFNINNHGVSLVVINSIKERLIFYIKYKNEIIREDNILTLLPETHEINQFSNADYIKKYASQIKDFIEKESNSIMIVDDIILKIIIKNEKFKNFFKILNKKNKKIIIFCDDYAENEYIQINNKINILKKDKLDQLININNNFEIIKEKMKTINNPFKDLKPFST